MSWLSINALAIAPVLILNQGQPSAPTVLKSVRIDASTAGSATIVIESSGALPMPQVGVLGSPPRIYLDFPGVTASTRGATAEPGGAVKRVRVALNQAAPPITRVVIDLEQPSPHQLDPTQREQGRLLVLVGAVASSGSPPASATATTPPASATAKTPPASAAADRAAASPVAGRPSARPATKADPAALSALLQLERLRPLLSSIDARTDLPVESLQMGIGEFEEIKQGLASDRPDPTRELLVKICVLGANAASTRIGAQQDEDPMRAWNAASAAAGALIMLDRASSLVHGAPVRN